ncbi:hypothetical protein GUJ93_ZPchr0003g18564 [Zizania palustris]|uniref:Uncharacterized protein n=1 Tax=Zizania palustris TaxID=103762 RepID=A0A8J5VL10_ZIZPA|nr:hypothetical protein GUJ93_ZPchr0003g18564 [Zizania palustris]
MPNGFPRWCAYHVNEAGQCEADTRPVPASESDPLSQPRRGYKGAPSPRGRRSSPSATTRRRFNAAPLTACSQLRSHRQVDLMSSGCAVASRVSCSSGNNGIFPPSLLPGFLGFPVVFALEDGFL